jgi:hypothetical protein
MGDDWIFAYSWEADIFSARQKPCALRGECLAVVEFDKSRDFDWMWREELIASSVAGSSSDVFAHVGTREGAHWLTSYQACQRFRGKASGSWTSIDTEIVIRVRPNVVCEVLRSAMNWTAATSNATCNRDAYQARSFVTLGYFAVTFISKAKGFTT